MKILFTENKWEYEVEKNEVDKNIKIYGFKVKIYRNDKLINEQGGFGAVSIAIAYARDYFLQYEFDVERETTN
jgi:hypothetical protein